MSKEVLPDLSDQVVLITGAGRGLGRSVALHLSRCGAVVGVADIDGAGAADTAAKVKAAGGQGSIINMSSPIIVRGYPNTLVYSAIKRERQRQGRGLLAEPRRRVHPRRRAARRRRHLGLRVIGNRFMSKNAWRQDLLDHVQAVIRDDIARGRYFGAVIRVGSSKPL
jgi:NAD(P)-dependent dehydrogenase (short-subunit alcohol dehydrogenase family)